ncbi:MAG: hypothetical protein KGL35_24755 [Bradyrhizobium sp.]|nr:hypothetical protein [Bradyrhizobium sp.]
MNGEYGRGLLAFAELGDRLEYLALGLVLALTICLIAYAISLAGGK